MLGFRDEMAASTSYQQSQDDLQYDHSPPIQTEQQKNAAQHQRTYQACIPCRNRKVRCDLGPVDSPHDPPCVRCRREAKECYFSQQRRKRKEAAESESGANQDSEDYASNGGPVAGRKKARRSEDGQHDAQSEDYDQPRTPGGSKASTKPLRKPTTTRIVYTPEAERAGDQTAALLQATEIHGGHDALKLLSAAAFSREKTIIPNESRSSFSGISPESLQATVSPPMDHVGNAGYAAAPLGLYQDETTWQTRIDPGIAMAPTDSPGYTSAFRAWSRFRFVRAGWFTPKEAMDYIDYFYKFLSPLTPVALGDFRRYETHVKLLTQEPMLTVTMLLVASRHMKLDGPGAVSRPYAVHQKLWTYLSGMIDRVVWGQEGFGGGFHSAFSAAAQGGSDVNPLSRKGLRTLGTVESLVMLTEWHPRAMHFPPDEADEELMIPDEPLPLFDNTDSTEASKGIGGQRMDSWLEPCWRSDRMCWMLLGMAMSLAFEIGVFDASDWQRHARSADGSPLSADELQAYDRRRGSVRDLLLVYVTQTSGRLGLTSMLPSNYSKPEDSSLYARQLGQQETVQQTVLHFWLRMAAIMREGNQSVFANKAYTRDIIRNGQYKGALEALRIPLEAWRKDFEKCRVIPKHMRHIMEIEYEYSRVYLNSLALQAVAERCANDTPFQIFEPAIEIAARTTVTPNGIKPPDIAIAPQTLANVAIILLKSFALGASESEVSESLNLMDRTVEALRTCIVDDVHVASRFADLLDSLTQSLKPRLVRIATDGRMSNSRQTSKQGTPAATGVSAQLPHHLQQQSKRRPSVSGAANMPQQGQEQQQAQFRYGNDRAFTNPSNNIPSSTAYSMSDPLYGVSSDTYDLLGNDYSVMPPPSFGLHSPPTRSNSNNGNHPTYDPYAFNAAGGGLQNGMAQQDWFALPLDPIMNMNGVDVQQTMYGPEIDGQDMLELLLGGNMGGSGGAGNGFG